MLGNKSNAKQNADPTFQGDIFDYARTYLQIHSGTENFFQDKDMLWATPFSAMPTHNLFSIWWWI